MNEQALNRDDIPRTFERGPSDPPVLADGPGTWVQERIDVAPDVVWAAVTDIALPARFSEEFVGAEWVGDDGPTGPRLGASFIGRNFHPAAGEWQVPSFVDVYDEGRAFGWATSDIDHPGARWRFRLTPTDGGTLLRFEMALGPGPSGLTPAIEAMPDKESRIIHRRISEHHANMTRTVEGIRQLLESP